ncbi:MAG: pentapeptide repeat-containing protein [Planctomycetaceae bacterium]
MASDAPFVRPRYTSPSSGEILTLEETVAELFRQRSSGVVEICGPTGSGKTTALIFLARRLSPDLNVCMLQHPLDGAVPPDRRVIAEVGPSCTPLPHRIARLNLAGWQTDDVIEYASSIPAADRGSVISRFCGAEDRYLCGEIPEICSVVIDRFRQNRTLNTVADAIRDELTELVGDSVVRHPAVADLLSINMVSPGSPRPQPLPLKAVRLLRHRIIQDLAVAAHVADRLNRGCAEILRQDPAAVARGAEFIPGWLSQQGCDRLRTCLADRNDDSIHPQCASLLLTCDPTWTPDRKVRPRLTGSKLTGARWAYADLRRYQLDRADLGGAILDGALLSRASAASASFHSASLRYANLRRMTAHGCNLDRASLQNCLASNAGFTGASFVGADASDSSFSHADLTGADLTDAILCRSFLRGALLDRAILEGCNLSGADLGMASVKNVCFETCSLRGTSLTRVRADRACFLNVQLEDTNFAGAVLAFATFTGSQIRNADFGGADLSGVYLADAVWEACSLRSADLRGATFHMGSSRSGLVPGGIVSEGTRTGFYTTDFEETLYKSAEEIRAASLKCCDLRDARTDGVDFWRVDLRGAILDEHVRRQAIATGAILD